MIEPLLAEATFHKKLWDLYVDYNEQTNLWEKAKLKNLDHEFVEQKYKDFRRVGNNLQVLYEGKKNPSMPNCVKICKGMVKKLNNLKDTIPLIGSLTEKGLMDRHKKNIFKALG